jgi:uncharacterized membrane protein
VLPANAAERWVSLIGGSGLVVYGAKVRSKAGAAMAVIGGTLVARAIGSMIQADPATVTLREVVSISRLPAEVYAQWRQLQNLPQLMEHVQSVTTDGNGRSHWVADGLLGRTVEWDADTTEDQPNRRIAWRSTGNTLVPNHGEVVFEEAPGGRGTIVRATVAFQLPAGSVGASIAGLLRQQARANLRSDLRKFKAMLEAGEVPTTEGQPHGQVGGIYGMVTGRHAQP